MKKLLAVLLTLMLLGTSCFATDTNLAEEPLIAPAPEDTYWEEESWDDAYWDEIPDYITVYTGTEEVFFPDAEPVLKDNRTMVPFRALLEAMGAEVGYDKGTVTAAFADGTVLTLQIGSKTMTRSSNGETATVQMDVAPYIDAATGRTYIPARFVGEALDMEVLWDGDWQTVYITDWQAVKADIDSRFGTFNRLMSSQPAADPTKNYAGDLELALELIPAGFEAADPATLQLTGTALSSQTIANETLTLDLDLGGLSTVAQTWLNAETLAMLELLDGSSYEIILDLTAGNMFLQAQLLTALSQGIIPQDTWLHFDMQEMLGAYDAAALQPAASTTIGGIIVAMYEGSDPAMLLNPPAADAYDVAAILQLLYGDDSFTTTQKGTTTVYTSRFDLEKLVSSMYAPGELTEEELAEIEALMTMDLVFTFTAADDQLTGMTCTMNMDIEGVTAEMTMDVSTFHVDMTLEMAADELGQLKLTLNSDSAETNEVPLTKPADGESVLTLEELEAMLEQLQAALPTPTV